MVIERTGLLSLHARPIPQRGAARKTVFKHRPSAAPAQVWARPGRIEPPAVFGKFLDTVGHDTLRYRLKAQA